MGPCKFCPNALAPARTGDDPGDSEIGPVERLTCIHERIHYTATPDATEEQNELYEIQIDTFLSTLAEIALSVARRKEHLDQ